VSQTAVSFTVEFGFAPAFEYGSDSDGTVPNLAISGTMSLGNSGDELLLRDNAGLLIDSVVWETGDTTGTGWNGIPITPYDQGSFGIEGQILYRKPSQLTGRPIGDTDSATDWAQATDDNINGKKVLYPGWDLDRYFQTAQFTQTAVITYLVAPDHIFLYVQQAINEATSSIRYEGYTFDNADLGQALATRAAAGVSVTVLLEGAPVGGIENQDKWVCQQIEQAGGQCWYMVNDSAATPPIHDRYAYQHSKVLIVDSKWLLTGSENFNYSSMPSDNKSDGTSGNRGVWLWTDAAGPISHALDVFNHDFDPANHRDLKRWSAPDPTHGAPPPGFVPSFASGGTTYQVRFPQPFVSSGTYHFELVQSPDNSLRSFDGLIGLVSRAGNGDRVLVEQLYEYTYWGPTSSNTSVDPNPRLEAYIAAARRGAKVRILLDSVFNSPADPRGNTATCAYVTAIANAESLDIACLLGNPTGTGIHNKMVLVSAGGQGWVHTGSINGSENSSKQNREMAVQVHSTEAYQYLADVFWSDWAASGGQVPLDKRVYLPLILKNHPPPPPPPTATPLPTGIPTATPTNTPVLVADLRITGLIGTGTPEVVTIRNMGTASQTMTDWTLVSVVGPQTYTFPIGYVLGPGASVQVQSYTGAAHNPPDILLWTTAAIWNNSGDKAELRSNTGTLVSSACYGNACP
jgi:phosphatidylserine/phosphatidylglycerophosphate/cardiolipin synthase-like enzyme